jgi:hypothetical protein
MYVELGQEGGGDVEAKRKRKRTRANRSNRDTVSDAEGGRKGGRDRWTEEEREER